MKSRTSLLRRARFGSGLLEFPPENELGVVYLFAQLARRRFGLKVQRIQAGYPDCIATLAGKPIRIEFEYRSRNFAQQRHDPRECDWIVCWIHDWPDKPNRLRVIELRKEFGMSFNVWFQPTANEYAKMIEDYDVVDWSVASEASEGDIVLIYRAKPDFGFIKDIFRITGPVTHEKANWKSGMDWGAPMRRVCKLAAPLRWEDLKAHPHLTTAGFVRGSMRGRYRATEYWPTLYDMILSRNPSAKGALAPYGPERIAY